MKKLVFFAFIPFLIYIIHPHLDVSNGVGLNNDYEVIPDDAIRLRILANSDEEEDQELKNLVRDRVNKTVSEWVEQITDIAEARQLIKQRLPEIEKIAKEVIEEEGKDNQISVDYGENITFPMKLYGDYLYPAGEYEAILITIGEGNGSNWWCVLFPPLCFLDFSFGTTTAEADFEQDEQEEETEVKFFLFEWFSWL